MPAFPELTEPLRDGRVALRIAAERDIPEVLIAHQDDPELFARLGMTRPPSGAELGRQAEQAAAERACGEAVTFTILEPGSDDCRGQVRTHPVEWEHARAALCVWVAPDARRRALGRSALRLTARWLFDACRLERVQLVVPPSNVQLRCAARAAGFLDEGVPRGHALERGPRVDCVVLSLLAADLAT